MRSPCPRALHRRRWPRRRSCATASRWPTFRSPAASPIAAPAPTSSPAHDLRSAGRLGDGCRRPARQAVPGLATEWAVNDGDKTLWTFKLRPGVKFHDGSAFNADAVVWNLEKVFNKDAPQFDQRQASQVRPRLPSVASYKKIDDMTVEMKTKAVDALFPYQMLWFLVGSPATGRSTARTGTRWRRSRRAPARSSSPAWCRASAPSW